MEIKNLYKITIFYNQRFANFCDDKIIFSDSDNIHNLTNLPEDTAFVFCEKWDDEKRDFVAVKNYAIGHELNALDLYNELEKQTDKKQREFIDYIINHILPINKNPNKKYCIFKNRDNVCFYRISDAECEVFPESQLVNGRVNEAVENTEKDYISLE